MQSKVELLENPLNKNTPFLLSLDEHYSNFKCCLSENEIHVLISQLKIALNKAEDIQIEIED